MIDQNNYYPASLIQTKDASSLQEIKDNIYLLDSIMKRGSIDTTRVAEYANMRKHEIKNYILQLVELGKIDKVPWQQNRTRSKNGEKYSLWVTKIDGKYVTAATEDALYEKLFCMFTADTFSENVTLEALYIKAMIAKNHSKTSGKTLEEYHRIWKSYYQNSELAGTDIRKITAKMWKKFFLNLVENNSLTYTQFKQIRIVANLIIKYCVTEEDNLMVVPIRDIDFSDLPFKDEDNSKVKARSFTDEDFPKILAWAEAELKKPLIKPLYVYAILFNLFLGLRFAELQNLLWDDIDWKNQTIYVHKQTARQVKMNADMTFEHLGRKQINHLKQHVKPHSIKLPDLSFSILQKIKDLKLSDTYIFPAEGEFRYHTYNDKIKKMAKAIGLNPKDFHTHCLRATAGTTIYKYSGGDIEQVRHQLRHTNIAMSSKYVNNWWTTDAVDNTIKKAMNICLPCLPESFQKKNSEDC